MSAVKTRALAWDEVYDDDGNVGFDAACRVYGPDDTFDYRVRQRLESNRIVWTLSKSDHEVVDAEDRDERFTSAYSAKRRCEKLEREHRQAALKEVELCPECEKDVQRDTLCATCGDCEECCECEDDSDNGEKGGG